MNESATQNPEALTELKKLNKLAQEIEDHNSSLSEVSMGIRSIAAGIAKAATGEDFSMDSGAEAQRDAVTDAHIETTNIIAKYDELVKKYGLTLQPLGSDREDGVNTGKILITITDPDLFVRKARGLMSAEGVDGTGDIVKTAIAGYEQQIRRTEGDVSEESARTLIGELPDACAALDEISDQIDMTRIQSYAKAAAREELADYLAVEKLGLWQKVGEGFGPSTWVINISPELLDEKWQQNIDALNSLPRSSKVYLDLRNHLIESISHAHSLIDTLTDYPDSYPRDELKGILEKYTGELVADLRN